MAVRTKDGKTARERLLQAADELFYTEGVHVVGVDRIAERAEVTKATLYNAFGSKDELVRAYLERHMQRRQDRIGRILAANDTPRKRILGMFAEVEQLLGGSTFRGCRFILATAESLPGDASELVDPCDWCAVEGHDVQRSLNRSGIAAGCTRCLVDRRVPLRCVLGVQVVLAQAR